MTDPTGDPSNHHKFAYGWHGVGVYECPECGTETRRKNYQTSGSAMTGYVCPWCYPYRKRLARFVKGVFSRD